MDTSVEADIKDLSAYNRAYGSGAYYRGNAGQKYGIIIDGELWLVKFPQSTKEFAGKHLPSYTSSPVSEYIGSKIYESLGIPVHETMLGYRDGKIVVACKDFDPQREFIDFHQIKNTVDEALLASGSRSSSRGSNLEDVLTVLREAKEFTKAEGSLERFWDMFVVDALIRNNDRNDTNWGVLAGQYGTFRLAPVFDNGNCLFNKRNTSLAQLRLENDALLEQDAIGTGVSFFLDNDGNHIHPFDFMLATDNADCKAAVVRVAERLDLNKVREIVESVPEQAFSREVLSREQKDFYKELLETAANKGLYPAADKISSVSLV
ncbi:hypothetical protein EGYY_25060 [Eggerthella sp. YY7918]|nr:hypothetical protein EGYY_25060 [Eggerthella sp. YY7918]